MSARTVSDSGHHPSRRGMLTATAAVAAGSLLTGTAEAATRRELMFVSPWQGTQMYGAWFDPATGGMTPLGPVGDATSNWSALHPVRPILYVGGSQDGGLVFTYEIDRATGALTAVGSPIATDAGGTGGGGLAYIVVDEPSHSLLVANFEAGLVASLPLSKGRLGEPLSVVHTSGTGPSPRQAAPHPHDITIDPTGRYALVPDFGADRVFVFRFSRSNGAITDAELPGYATAAGSGPRRIVFHPDGRTAFLFSELTATLEVLDWDPHRGALTQREAVPTDSPAHTGSTSGAELGVSADGRFVYVSNRGENALVVYAYNGSLAEIQRLPCGGQVPWSFTIHSSGRWLLVANEISDTVNLFSVDSRSGLLTDTSRALSIPNPSCITFCP